MEDFAVAIGLDDALLSWLVASAGDLLVGRLRGERGRRAVRDLVEAAVPATVAVVGRSLEPHQAEHLCSVLREHDAQVGEVRVSSLAELREAVGRWVSALDRGEFGGPGYLTGLGVDAGWLCAELTGRIASGIRERGRAGGPLEPVAEWLWRDELSSEVGQIRWDLARLGGGVGLASSHRGGLPGVTPEFTGREDVLAELATRVEEHDPAGIVVAIHAVDGMAGVGKTELALRAGHQHKHRYPDGQYFVNLHGYTEGIAPVSPAAALEQLLRQAGLAGVEIPPDLGGRQARWQALMVAQQALVLLDNALDADQVHPLLPRSAGCLVLITSRSRLQGLPGTRTLPLEVPPQREAVTLFNRVVGTLRDLEPELVAKAVDLVGRLPVAVRAVAGQVGDGYTVAELVEDLREAKARTGLVETGSPLGAGVRAAFQTSLQRLDHAHQQAFRALGVHPGPTVGIPQFAAVTGLPAARAGSLLRGLADRNLVSPVADRVGHRRYQLHDLVREFARQQADHHMPEEDRTAAIARLTAWYAAAIGILERLWDTDIKSVDPDAHGLDLTDLGQARSWLAAEQDNLLAFAELATGAEAARVCGRSARRFYQLDHHATARTLYQITLDLHQQTGDRDGEADALTGLGQVARATGNYPGAGGYLRRAFAICRQTGNQDGKADALIGLGDSVRATGGYLTAGRHFHRAWDIYRQTGNRNGEADAAWGLGLVARATGQFSVAGNHYRNALDICEQTGNRNGKARALTGLGDVARTVGEHTAAEEHYRQALAIHQQTGNRSGETYARWGLGHVAQAAGEYRTASGHFRLALRICEQTGNRNGKARALAGLGDADRATGAYRSAGERYRHALAVYQQIGGRDGEADTLTGLGLIALAAGDPPAAAEHFRRALAIYQKTGNRDGEAATLTNLGQVASVEGRPMDARERWRAALMIQLKIGSPQAGAVRQLLKRPERDSR